MSKKAPVKSPCPRESPEGVALRDNLLFDFETLRNDESTCDFEFIVGHERVKAHRLIIVSRCEKYRGKKRQWLVAGGEQKVFSVQLGKHHSVNAVRGVVNYLYTGKINLFGLNPFRILILCPELGLPALQSFTLHHIKSTLTTDNVCQVLLAANGVLKDSKGDQVSSPLQEIVQGCLDFIGDNTSVVFQGDNFLDLPRSILVSIIANNKVSAPQDEVWRAVVHWGQHHTGVDGEPGVWREGERKKMEETLEGLLEHIRVMEISEEVFANEVEPTGLLSVETALAKHRLSGAAPDSGVGEPFADSAILARRGELQTLITEWCDLPGSDWMLLYRGSRDGFEGRAFHSCCDEKGATVVIVKSVSGCVFGGYTDASWTSRFKRGKFVASRSSCLFTLINPSQTPPTKYPIKQTAYAINNHPSNGPIFGSGADLCISTDCNMSTESYSQLGHSYGDSSIQPHLFTGEQYFTVDDYEVFCLSTSL